MKRFNNTDQAYFKETFDQKKKKKAYFIIISEGASWPAWLKSRRAGIRKD